jgi:hypothetical protein
MPSHLAIKRTKHRAPAMKSLAPAAAIVLALSTLWACTAPPPIDPDRNSLAVGQRERRGEHQIRWLIRDRTEKYSSPERVFAYFEKMGQRLAPAPIEGELVLGQVRESSDAWDRFLSGRW